MLFKNALNVLNMICGHMCRSWERKKIYFSLVQKYFLGRNLDFSYSLLKASLIWSFYPESRIFSIFLSSLDLKKTETCYYYSLKEDRLLKRSLIIPVFALTAWVRVPTFSNVFRPNLEDDFPEKDRFKWDILIKLETRF